MGLMLKFKALIVLDARHGVQIEPSFLMLIANIQSLRGGAAFAVFLFHLIPVFHYLGIQSVLLDAVLSWGYLGVDVFFVISGWVMARSVSMSQPAFSAAKRFATKRLLRIYLGYWPMLLLMVGYFVLFEPHRLADFGLWENAFILTERQPDLMIPPAWSLAYELYFYGLMTCVVFVTPKWRLFCVGLMMASVLLANAFDFDAFFLSPFLLEFGMGYLLFVWGHRMGFKLTAVVFVLSVVALGLWGFQVTGLPRSITAGAFAVALMQLLILAEQSGHKTFKWLQKIGDASYSLYLFHMIAVNVFMASGLAAWGKAYAIPVAVCLVTLTILLSIQIYRWIEKPLYQWSVKKAVIE